MRTINQVNVGKAQNAKVDEKKKSVQEEESEILAHMSTQPLPMLVNVGAAAAQTVVSTVSKVSTRVGNLSASSSTPLLPPDLNSLTPQEKQKNFDDALSAQLSSMYDAAGGDGQLGEAMAVLIQSSQEESRNARADLRSKTAIKISERQEASRLSIEDIKAKREDAKSTMVLGLVMGGIQMGLSVVSGACGIGGAAGSGKGAEVAKAVGQASSILSSGVNALNQGLMAKIQADSESPEIQIKLKQQEVKVTIAEANENEARSESEQAQKNKEAAISAFIQLIASKREINNKISNMG